MAKLDPWTSIELKSRVSHFTCMRDDVGSFRPSKMRDALLATLGETGLRDELGLRLRDPKKEMPWIKTEVEFGSLLHWHWTAFHAMYPAEFWRRVSALSTGDATGVEDALVFLEAGPLVFPIRVREANDRPRDSARSTHGAR